MREAVVRAAWSSLTAAACRWPSSTARSASKGPKLCGRSHGVPNLHVVRVCCRPLCKFLPAGVVVVAMSAGLPLGGGGRSGGGRVGTCRCAAWSSFTRTHLHS